MSLLPAADITVVIVTWQGRDLTKSALESLATQTQPHRVLVVDNASTDGTTDMLRADFPDADVLALQDNTGFAGGAAAALGRVSSRYVALLNNDALADPRWLEHSLAMLEQPQVAAVSAKMLLTDRQSPGGTPLINNAGVALLSTGYGADRGLGIPDGADYAVPARVFGFSGGAAVLRTLAVKAVGGFDASYFMYYEDTDLSWRLRLAGWEILYCSDAVVHHRHAATSDPDSEMFAFHNERNRLLTLLRNAPLGYAAAKLARFMVTTGSLTLRHWLRRDVPARQVFLPQLRLRVLGSVVRLLPRTLAKRTTTRVSRAEVVSAWAGTASRDWSR
ncbi:hypothetical protein CLV47_12077 [Antricoccus suffuscus]|uniref:GT2 family glycosyltransferase n=1 Tax=Antricoccus suffuscus TaxID=1629062 RepID=A0A2T0ZQJ7_9ACTN|nr:glycosyltransferase family 2 protein [Antricoccus suffuscus]PRZ38610.1 hypothetical protein CLV47_12077 [Antricoccus suffuscus]